jgi:hypothetical protein
MRSPVRTRHLFVLSAFAIAQPVFDLLGRNAEFLSSHAAGAPEIFGLVALLLAAPPLLLAGLCLGLGRISPSLGQTLGHTFVGLLCALIAVAPSLRWSALPEALAVTMAAALGLIAALAHARYAFVGRLLDWMVVVPPLFAGLFLLNADVRKLWLPSETRAASTSVMNARAVPIVFLVLDELPLSSLQGVDGNVDAGRLPSFARLAQTSTWFRGASGVSSLTSVALPAILSGRYPGDVRKLPVLADYPDNLFSWLAPRFRLHVIESETLLHPDSRGRGAGKRARSRQRTLLVDTALVYLHTILPTELRGRLPDVSGTWGDFWGPGESSRLGRGQQDALRHATRREQKKRGFETEIEAFRDFVDTIEAMGNEPETLHFLHVTHPHSPWRLLPSGRSYRPHRKLGFENHEWSDEPWWSIDAYRRHLLQVGHADRLLGELMDRLERVGLFDSALLIVTADHGAGFWPGDSFRGARSNHHPEDLLGVPLFVKLPHQVEGRIDERPVENIDIVPTIAQVLGLELPWPIDGCSLLRDDCPALEKRRLVHNAGGRRLATRHIDLEVLERTDTLERKLALFGSDGTERGLYLASQWPSLVGRSVAELIEADASGGTAVLHDAVREALEQADPEAAPARIVAELDAPGEVPVVALAVGGVIEAVVPAPRDDLGAHRISAMLPEPLLPRLASELRLYLVEGDTAHPALVPLDMR